MAKISLIPEKFLHYSAADEPDAPSAETSTPADESLEDSTEQRARLSLNLPAISVNTRRNLVYNGQQQGSEQSASVILRRAIHNFGSEPHREWQAAEQPSLAELSEILVELARLFPNANDARFDRSHARALFQQLTPNRNLSTRLDLYTASISIALARMDQIRHDYLTDGSSESDMHIWHFTETFPDDADVHSSSPARRPSWLPNLSRLNPFLMGFVMPIVLGLLITPFIHALLNPRDA